MSSWEFKKGDRVKHLPPDKLQRNDSYVVDEMIDAGWDFVDDVLTIKFIRQDYETVDNDSWATVEYTQPIFGAMGFRRTTVNAYLVNLVPDWYGSNLYETFKDYDGEA